MSFIQLRPLADSACQNQSSRAGVRVLVIILPEGLIDVQCTVLKTARSSKAVFGPRHVDYIISHPSITMELCDGPKKRVWFVVRLPVGEFFVGWQFAADWTTKHVMFGHVELQLFDELRASSIVRQQIQANPWVRNTQTNIL